MKKVLLVIVFLVLLGFGAKWLWNSDKPREGLVGGDFSFTAATSTVTSVGTTTLANITNWTALKYSGNGSQGFVSICDNADGGVSVNNPVYLGFGATSTKPFGFRLASGDCYRMTLAANNMFYGTIYALASTASTTILEIYK